MIPDMSDKTHKSYLTAICIRMPASHMKHRSLDRPTREWAHRSLVRRFSSILGRLYLFFVMVFFFFLFLIFGFRGGFISIFISLCFSFFCFLVFLLKFMNIFKFMNNFIISDHFLKIMNTFQIQLFKNLRTFSKFTNIFWIQEYFLNLATF